MPKIKHVGQRQVHWIWLISLAFSLSFSIPIKAQESSIGQLENEYKDLFGVDKLKALNELCHHYSNEESRKALRYGRQAVNLSENIFVSTNSAVDFTERPHQARAYLLLGKVLFNREDYFDAQEKLNTAKVISIQTNTAEYETEAEVYLQKIQALIVSGEVKQSFLSKTLGKLKVGELIGDTSKDLAIQTEVKLGSVSENKGNFQSAINHYEKVINLLRNKGDGENIKKYQLKIAVMLDSLNEHVKAQKYLNEAITYYDSTYINKPLELKKDNSSTPSLEELIQHDSTQVMMRDQQQKLKNLAERYREDRNFEKSLAYERMYQELSRKMETDSLKTEAKKNQTKSEIILLKQQKTIADLKVSDAEKEREKQVKFRNILFIIAALILLGTLTTFYFYSAKKREHKKLASTHSALKITKTKLVDAEHRIVTLLEQQLSGDIAQELLVNGTNVRGERCFVCIMFLDIRDFTSMAEKLSPEELILYQNEVFGFMIDVVQKYNGNINQLLGDGFMATFGAPISHGNDCQNAFSAAKQILAELKKRVDGGIVTYTKIGIGLHAGNVVTGNVGNETRKQYSVTGNPVIIASRVEQLNKEYKTQLIITEQVYTKLDEKPKTSKTFLEVNVKGRKKPIKILRFD